MAMNFFDHCDPEISEPEIVTIPAIEDDTYILLACEGTLIRYPYTRFLIAISSQAKVTPWELAQHLTDADSVHFGSYCLPFQKGELIWVNDKLKPVLRKSLIRIPEFWAFNPVMYEEVQQAFREEKEWEK